MINVLYSSLVVCFYLMFPQTKYKYDLLLLRQNDSLFYLHMYITLLSYVFYAISMYTVSLIYLERGLYLENKLLSLSPKYWGMKHTTARPRFILAGLKPPWPRFLCLCKHTFSLGDSSTHLNILAPPSP